MAEDQKNTDEQQPVEGEAVVAEEGELVGVVAAEADPHGATIVAAVGGADGIEAVAVVETDYFDTLLVRAARPRGNEGTTPERPVSYNPCLPARVRRYA